MSVHPSDILNSLETETLQDLYFHEHQDQRGSKLTKPAMVRDVSESIEEAGIRALLTSLKREDLKKLISTEDVDWKKDNKNSKTVLVKKLLVSISKEGINDYLTEHVETDLLKTIATDLGLEVNSDKKEELVKHIGDAVRVLGVESYFSSLNVDSLQDVCEDLKLKTGGTNNKRKLVESIVKNEDVPKEPKAKKAKVEFNKKKQPIKKGVTFDDVFQHYYVDEVRDWCKEHDIKTSGKKAVLIKRILAFLDGDESVKVNEKKAANGSKGKGRGGKAKKEVEEEKGGDKAEKEEKADEKKNDEEDKQGTKKAGKK